jgi:DNA repair ATPase RecN
MERLQAEGIQSAQEAATAVATVERLGKQLQRLEQFTIQLEEAEQLVETEASNLQICRETLTGIRQDFIRQLFECDDMLKVDLRSMADARGAAESLRNILRLPENAQFADVWAEDEAQNPVGFLWDATDPVLPTSVGERLHTMRLDLECGSKQVLRTSLHGKLLNRLKDLPPETFDELACWFPEDEVQLEYRPADGASYKSIQQASAGQKTAALLSFLLAHGEEPLLLDQPEDDLDNALVSRLVVAQLRKNKTRRQLIIVTHNANIVVNGDAELVMTMDFAGGQISLASKGGLQEREVRKDICRVMEGGEEAFRQRYKRILKDLEARP